MLITLLIITILCWGVAPIFDKAALNTGAPLAGMMLRSIVIGVMMAVAAGVTGTWRQILLLPSRSMMFFTLSGFLAGGLGVLVYYKALQMDTTSRVVPIAATYPLITALLGVMVFGERLSMDRMFGIVLIAVGVWLVK